MTVPTRIRTGIVDDRRTHRDRTGMLAVVLLAAGCARVQPTVTVPPGGVEQTTMGRGPAGVLVESFDGLANGFNGPQGSALLRNPSDNTLAVGRDHIVQIVNSRLAIFSRAGGMYDTTGRVLYGPVPTNTLFHAAGGACGARNSGDAVVRYDQLADRWLVVIPVFQRSQWTADDPKPPVAGGPAVLSRPLRAGQPGPAVPLFVPPPMRDTISVRPPPARDSGAYAMCYAMSETDNPLGSRMPCVMP